MTFEQNGFVTNSQLWTESLFRERDVTAIVGAHVQRVEEGKIFYETLQGEEGAPVRLRDAAAAVQGSGPPRVRPIGPGHHRRPVRTERVPQGRRRPHAETVREDWRASDWPSTYANPTYGNVFGVGIAFAPPHQISRPRKTAGGTVITPAPPGPACRRGSWVAKSPSASST